MKLSEKEYSKMMRTLKSMEKVSWPLLAYFETHREVLPAFKLESADFLLSRVYEPIIEDYDDIPYDGHNSGLVVVLMQGRVKVELRLRYHRRIQGLLTEVNLDARSGFSDTSLTEVAPEGLRLFDLAMLYLRHQVPEK